MEHVLNNLDSRFKAVKEVHFKLLIKLLLTFLILFFTYHVIEFPFFSQFVTDGEKINEIQMDKKTVDPNLNFTFHATYEADNLTDAERFFLATNNNLTN